MENMEVEVMRLRPGVLVMRPVSVLMEVRPLIFWGKRYTESNNPIIVAYEEFKVASEMELVPRRISEGSIGMCPTFIKMILDSFS